MIQTIINEMFRGNFSFLILVVGIIQLIVMIKNYQLTKKNTKKKDDKDISRLV